MRSSLNRLPSSATDMSLAPWPCTCCISDITLTFGYSCNTIFHTVPQVTIISCCSFCTGNSKLMLQCTKSTHQSTVFHIPETLYHQRIGHQAQICGSNVIYDEHTSSHLEGSLHGTSSPCAELHFRQTQKRMIHLKSWMSPMTQ